MSTSSSHEHRAAGPQADPDPGVALSSGASQATNVRWLILLMLMGFTFLGHFNRVSISVAGSERLIGSHGMTEEQMGMVYSAFLLIYTLGMLPGGWVIDRLGPCRALTGMGLGMGFCVAMTGVLGWSGLPIVSLWLPLLAIRGMAGGLSVPLHPGAARSVSLWMPLTSRSTANGLVTAGALVGISATYPVFGWLMDKLDWPLAFVVSGTVMMLFALLWYRFSADDPASHRWTNRAEQELMQVGGIVLPRSRVSLRDFLGMFCNGGLILLTLSYAAVGYFQYLFFYWIGYYFEKQLHLPGTESRQAAFTVTMSMAVGMGVGGLCTDLLCRRFGRRWGCRGMALAGMGLSALFAWQGVSAKDPNHVVWLFSFALASLGACEGLFWTTAPMLARRTGGLACAFLNTVGNAGGLLAPVLTPWIGGRYGWTAAIAVACVVCGVGAVLWLWIDSEGKAEAQPLG